MTWPPTRLAWYSVAFASGTTSAGAGDAGSIAITRPRGAPWVVRK